MLTALATAVLLTAAPLKRAAPRPPAGTYLPLIAAGISIASLAWVITAGGWAANSRSSSEPTKLALVPLIGPWLALRERGTANYTHATATEWRGAMAVSGVAQGIGLVSLMLGFHLKSRAGAEVAVVPLVGRGVRGLSVAATF